jgi:1,4-alpha-glucan branching enzyme
MSPLSDQDLYLFNEGTYARLFETLGAHPTRVDGRDGTHFAVWAPNAHYVAVVGDFNGWDPQRTRMIRLDHEGRWTARLKLPPGVHQYSFVIDGSTWVPDPGAKTTLADGFGGRNSVIIVDS